MREGSVRSEVAPSLLTHSRLLGERVYVHTLVGLGVSVVIIVGALVARYVVGITELDVTALVILGAFIALYDSVAYFAIRSYRKPSTSMEAQAYVRKIKYATIVLDYLVLTVAIWFVGGARSPFLPFYLLHVIVSCLLLSRRAAITLHTLAYGLLAALVIGEWSGILPAPRMPAGAVSGTGPLDPRYALTILVVYGLLFGLTAYLLLGLARTLRTGERQLRRANEELERLSSMRRDFLRIALHNLQSPIGVVTMFLNNLRVGLGGNVTEQQASWIERSLARLRGVTGFMHDLQMLTTLESGRVEVKAAPVNVPLMLTDLVAENEDLAKARGHRLTLDVERAIPTVWGIELLVREGVANYITNAIKYTPEGGQIVVRAVSRPPMVRIEVQDDGVGISPEDQERLFSEFVRVKRSGTPVDKAKGTGLGLTIVRRVAETHGGRIGIESQIDQGSTFFLELPSGETAEAGVAPARHQEAS